MRAEPSVLVRTDHGSSMIRCAPTKHEKYFKGLVIILIIGAPLLAGAPGHSPNPSMDNPALSNIGFLF